MTKIKKGLKKWNDVQCSRIGIFNIIKMPVLPNLINRFNEITNNIPASYFVDTDKLILQFIQEAKESEQPAQF